MGDQTNDSKVYDLDEDNRIYSTSIYSLAHGEDYRNADGGFYPSNHLGNQVWIDNRVSGRIDGYDAGDELIEDVEVNLYDATTDELIATTWTDNFGRYLFQRLRKGIYYVGFVAPADYTFVTANAFDSDDKEDSDAIITDLSDPSRSFTQAVGLGIGDVNFTLDAGLMLNGESGPLAVDNLSLSGRHDEDKNVNQLWWTTDSEVNSDKFIIERSIGSTQDFVEIGKMDGAGNSSTKLEYDYVDSKLEKGIHYYRINAIDLDATKNHI